MSISSKQVLAACQLVAMTTSLYAGMGVIHKILPLPSRKTWITAIRQGTLLDEVTPRLLFNADAGASGVITISASGVYKLAEDITAKIAIAVDNVMLDLGKHAVTRSLGSDNIISISGSNVTVKNGYIQNTDTVVSGGSGIVLVAGCSKVALTDITILGCTYGVNCAGASGSVVWESTFSGLNLISNTIGMLFSYADSCQVFECNALLSVRSGFELSNCQANIFHDCVALKTTGTASVAGYRTEQGTANVFQRCVAQQTKTSSTVFNDTANGFLLTGTELKTRLINCVVSETDVLSTPTAATIGIELRPVLQPSTFLLSEYARITTTGRIGLRTVAWSPSGNYLAMVAQTSNYVMVKLLDGTTVAEVNVSGKTPYSCAWSPDGKFLAVSFATDQEVYVYSFDGNALTFIAGDSSTGSDSFAIEWSPNGKYLVANSATLVQAVYLFGFDGTNLKLLSVSSFTSSSGSGYQFSWSADGNYVFVGPRASNLIVIPVLPHGKFGTQVTVPLATMTDVAASPNGRYIATADTGGNVVIWIWDGSTLSAVLRTGASAVTLTWSPCGNYLAVGTATGTGKVRIYSFNGTSITLLKEQAVALSGTGDISGISWSADGKYIAASRLDTVSAGVYVILRAMYGPDSCLIDDCSVSDSAASGISAGIGFAGGGSNAFTRNSSSNNSVPYSYGVTSSYYGRTDIARAVVEPYMNIALPSTL